MDGISALSIELNENLNKVALRVRVGETWMDLLMDDMEVMGLVNGLIAASNELVRSVDSDPVEEYNRVREEGTYLSAQQVQEARKNLQVVNGGKA